MRIEFTPEAQKNCELDEIIKPIKVKNSSLIFVYVEMLIRNTKGIEYIVEHTFVTNGTNTLRDIIEFNLRAGWFATTRYLGSKFGIKIKTALILDK